jgi:hypothetical protein
MAASTLTEHPKPRFAASQPQQTPMWPSTTGVGVVCRDRPADRFDENHV